MGIGKALSIGARQDNFHLSEEQAILNIALQSCKKKKNDEKSGNVLYCVAGCI